MKFVAYFIKRERNAHTYTYKSICIKRLAPYQTAIRFICFDNQYTDIMMTVYKHSALKTFF